MAYQKHFLFQFGGKLGGGEIWTCGVRFIRHNSDPITGDPFPSGDLSDMRDDLITWYQKPANKLAQTSTLEWLKCNAINEQGHYINQQTTSVIDFPAVHGGEQPSMGAFLSLAITWRTARTRPPGAFGRVYLPNYAVVTDSLDPLTVSIPQQNAIVNAGRDLLDVVRQSRTVDGVNVIKYIPVVASQVDGSLNIINRIEVGRRLDVQRRRENAIPEVPTGIAYDWQHS